MVFGQRNGRHARGLKLDVLAEVDGDDSDRDDDKASAEELRSARAQAAQASALAQQGDR
jgi:hypothetical protein